MARAGAEPVRKPTRRALSRRPPLFILDLVGYTLPKTAERAGRLRRELTRILPRIVSLDVERVILFGSLARGGVGSGSDIDLLVVRRTDRRFLDRLAEVYEAAQPRCAADILVYTPEEMKELGPSSPFLRRVLEEGEVLYEKVSTG
jgi:predicted nucleotidyltransferase